MVVSSVAMMEVMMVIMGVGAAAVVDGENTLSHMQPHPHPHPPTQTHTHTHAHGQPLVAWVSFAPNQQQNFTHFWRSCGWCPPDPHPLFPTFFNTEDVYQNHALIASTPRAGIKQVRIHFLLDLIGLYNGTDHPGNLDSIVFPSTIREYSQRQFWDGVGLNFSALDHAMDQLVSLDLAPGFEIMGNPGNAEDRSDRLFTDFGNHTQILAWRDLVSLIASRYIQRFGIDIVRNWRWESWNEPDGEVHKDLDVGINCDMDSFMAYWDACEAGLRSVDESLIFGGPASDGANMYLFGLVKHCLNGTNAISGNPGCGRPDYLNAHKKGNQDAAGVLIGEGPVALAVKKMTTDTPLAGMAWGNDEADPKVGWSHTYDWRGDSRYAAMVPKVINQHQDWILANDIKYDVLSNDNGFLSYADNTNHTFLQRTLVARWSYNYTKPRTIESVRKPVLNVMALLALLGNTIYTPSGVAPSLTSDFGVIATSEVSKSTSSVSVLVWRSNDSEPISNDPPQPVTLSLTDLPFSTTAQVAAVAWSVDEVNSNSHTAFVERGSPKYPTPDDLAYIRMKSELAMIRINVSVVGGNSDIILPVRIPSAVLLMICEMSVGPPTQVTGNVSIHSTGNAIVPQVIVKWPPLPEPCLQTYVIYVSSAPSGPWSRLNKIDTLFTAYTHTFGIPHATFNVSNLRDSSTSTCYSIAAMDIFGRIGQQSQATCVQIY